MKKLFLLFILLIVLVTYLNMSPVSSSFKTILSDTKSLQITDRNGVPLNVNFNEKWNVFDNTELHQIPDFLIKAFIFSEDKNFYEHNGVDWKARLAALKQNIQNRKIVRGASTITEQVVRMITPRKRNLWSKYIETFDAMMLDHNFSKAQILEFYLNQLPYASNRRGVLQASRFYFNRDLGTLTKREMLILVALARSPSGYDLYKNPKKINLVLDDLATAMFEKDAISKEELEEIRSTNIKLEKYANNTKVINFVNYVKSQPTAQSNNVITTTLDINLQNHVQKILDERIKTLSSRSLSNGAAIIADHTTGEVLAWVVSNSDIDAVTTPRQPGSALKPMLYALALDSGWDASTIISDSPMAESIGGGLHNFKNYSNIYYGDVTLREALANSLNIPALRTIQFVGVENYLGTLRKLGFKSLNREAEIYDDGLALGNGEVTLLELAEGYAALANYGVYRPFSVLSGQDNNSLKRNIYSEEAASLIANILSDPWARRLEFTNNSVLNFPLQTAVKTGTSTDYTDAWAIGFNSRYVAGIWMGNLDRTPTDGITGSTGPALALRSIFAELSKIHEAKPLYLSQRLLKKDICIEAGKNIKECFKRTEYFMPENDNKKIEPVKDRIPLITRPTKGLQMAVDPRIPLELQKFEFQMINLPENSKVNWYIDSEQIAQTTVTKYLWNLQKGKHQLTISIENENGEIIANDNVDFTVK